MSRTARLWLAVVPAALVVAAVAITLTLTSDHVEPPALAAVLGGLAGLSFIAAGLIARTRRPENRTGLLLIAVGFAWFGAGLTASDRSSVWTFGIIISALFAAFLVHLLLAYPTGRLHSRWERAVVVAGYVLACVGNIILLPFDESPITDCAECPSNALLIQENDSVSDLLTALVQVSAFVLLSGVVTALVVRWRRSSPPARRLLSPVLLAGGTTVFLLGLNVGAESLWPSLSDALGFAASVAFIATPFLFLWGILRGHLARAGLGTLIRSDYSLAEAQEEFRRYLRDPTATMVVWLETGKGYIDADGRPYELPKDSPESVVTEIADEEGPLGALVHDPALRDEELLGDLTAALRLNLQRLRSTAALEASERRSRALLEALPDNMYRISRDGVYLDFHAQDPSQLRLAPEQLIGSTVWDYPVRHETTEHLMAAAERAFESGSVETFEFEARLDDGTLLYREGRVSPSGPDEFLFITRDITDRKRAEAELRMSEQRSRALLQALPDAIYRVSREGTFLDFYSADLTPLMDPDKFVGANVYDYPIPRELMDRFMAAAEAAFDTGTRQTFDFVIDDEQGVRYQEARITPSGSTEFFVLVRDVTDRKEQELELLMNEQRSSALLQAIPDVMYRVSRDGTFLDYHASDAARDTDPTTVIGGHIYDYPAPRELLDRFMAAAENAFETGSRQTLEYTLEEEHGARHNEARITPSGTTEFFVVIRDVTDRKQQEQELQAERDFVAKVVNLAPTYFCVIDVDGRIVRFNDTLGEATGLLDSDKVRGRPFRDAFVVPEDAPEFDRILEIANKPTDPDPGEFDLRLRSGHGERLRVLWRGVDLRDEHGVKRYLLCGLDVTERAQRQEEQAALRRVAEAVASEQRTEQIFDLVTEEVARVLGADTANLVRFEPGGEEIVIVGRWSEPGVHALDVGQRIRLIGGPVAIVRETGEPARADIDSVSSDVAEMFRELGINSVVTAPITVSGRLWGAVTVSLTPPGVFPAGSEFRIGEFARLVSVALANAEARGELAAQRARIVTAGDEERRRLERNLHDGAQQRLVSLSLSLRLAQSKLGSDPHAADELLSGASIELALALEELRELARGIHPAVLTERGLGPALESLADRATLPVELEQLPVERLPGQVEAAAYYVVSEALANVSKYARASAVSVRVAQQNGWAVVEVEDDGVGGADPSGGSGLRGLADRVEALEGRLAVESTPGSGTTVRAEIPLLG